MVSKYDAVIVGGGVAGSTVGRLLAEQDYEVLIVEEHREVGRPMQCAGLVTPRIFDLVSDKSCILTSVRGAKIFSPGGQVLTIDAGETKAYVIDRVRLDQVLMVQALRAGCDLALGSRAVSAKRSGRHVVINILHDGRQETVQSKLIIGADGVQSRVARWFGLKGPKIMLSGFGAEMAGVELEPGLVEIYLGNKVAPNFFAWAIPKADANAAGPLPARVGLLCTNAQYPAKYYFDSLYSHPILGAKLQNAKALQYIAGGVPIGVVPKSYKDNVLLVGDAAGQVKPTSGGGVYTSLVCARYCAASVGHALEKNDCGAKVLRSYQKAWSADLGKELKQGLRLHLVFMHLRDDQLEDGFKLLGKEGVLKLISSEGDIDYPSKVTKKLFKKVPQLLKFAKPYLRSFF